MPRVIDPDLRDCLERANPYVRTIVELGVPDVSNVLRRPDQFVGAESALVSGTETPALSLSPSVASGLALTATSTPIAAYTGEQSSYGLNGEDPNRRVKGVAWQVDPAFGRATLTSFTAKINRTAVGGLFYFQTDFQLQIFRVLKTPGVKTVGDPGTSGYSATAYTDYQFIPLLPSAPIIKAASVVWASNKATLSFDLSQYGLVVESTPNIAAQPDQTGELPKYYFVVTTVSPPNGTGYFNWLTDTATSKTVANVGTFNRVFWARDNDQEQWVENEIYGDVPVCSVNVASFVATGQGVYALDLGRAPASDSTGRVNFQRSLPKGTVATLELATAGSTGPWTALTDGAAVATAQQLYWLRLTLTSDSVHRSSPGILAAGVEFTRPVDVSLESSVGFPTRQVNLPYPQAAVAEGDLTVVRTGIRDFLDVAGTLASVYSTTQIEANVYLGSDSPKVDRSKWLRLERLRMSDRTPSGTSEKFTTMSYASLLKQKIPAQTESINSVHTVVSSTAAAVVVSPNLPIATVSGNEYDGQNYYIRIRSTSKTIFPLNYQQVIQGNTGVDQLDFVPSLPDSLAVGDVIEVHSGVFAPVALEYDDQDLADVWADVFDQVGIPKERIGLGYLPRGGLPPRVTDWAPGDTDRQAALKATFKFTDLTVAQDILDQVSFIMGGATVEIDGQMAFIQLYPLRAADGTVTVPLAPVAKIFDIRDLAGDPDTPPGYEQRAPLITTNYGKDTTAADPSLLPTRQTAVVDSDALAWLDSQELEDLGNSQIPDDVAGWFFNSADAGLTLATATCDMVVRATSTGLRRFTIPTVDSHFDLVLGDTIVLVQDQYTDHDPATGLAIRGAQAIRGVLVSVGPEGRSLQMFVPGLTGNITNVAGGAPGAPIAVAPGLQPAQPTLSINPIPASGVVDVDVDADDSTYQTLVCLRTDRAPTIAEILASAFATEAGVPNGTVASVGTITPGQRYYIGAIAKSYYNIESLPAFISAPWLGPNSTPTPLVASSGSAVAQSGKMLFQVNANSATTKLELFRAYAATDPSSGSASGVDVEARAPGVWKTLSAGTDFTPGVVCWITVPMTNDSYFALLTIRPVDGLNQRGAALNLKAQGPGGSSPSAPGKPSIGTVTASAHSFSAPVTAPGSGGTIATWRLYADGKAIGDIACTASAGGTQTGVMWNGFDPSTPHQLQISGVTSAGVEGPLSDVASKSTTGDTSGGGSGTGANGKLPAPVAGSGTYSRPDQAALLDYTLGSGTPSGMTVRVWHSSTIGGSYSLSGYTAVASPALVDANQSSSPQILYYKLSAYDPTGGYTESDLSDAITVHVPAGSA